MGQLVAAASPLQLGHCALVRALAAPSKPGLINSPPRDMARCQASSLASSHHVQSGSEHPGWLEGITTVATDLAESYRAGLDNEHVAAATRVADPFHVVRVANRCVDTVRRRLQNETLGHRGRKHDPLYRVPKLLLSGSERLDERGSDRMLLGLRVGDPNDEVLGAWLAKESVRARGRWDRGDPAHGAGRRPSPPRC
jgi:hypothetical protein